MHDMSHYVRLIVQSLVCQPLVYHDIVRTPSPSEDKWSELAWVGVLDLAYVNTSDRTHGQEQNGQVVPKFDH
jgi:hypothetical protein